MRSNNKLFYPVSIVLCICLVCLGISYYNSDDVKFNRYFDKITNIEAGEVLAIDVHLSKDNKNVRFYIDNEKAFLMLDLLHEMKFLKQVSTNDENELDYTYGIWNAIETSESMFAIRLEVNQANYNIRITEINIDRNRNRQIETNKYFKANDKSAALLRELLKEVVAGEPDSSPGHRKDFYIMTASNAPHGCEYGTDRGRRMDTEQMLEELDELSGFVFNESLIRGSVIYRDKLLDGKHLEFHFLDEKPEKIEVCYIVGDAIEQEYRLYDYPIKVPEEPGIYNFFAQLTWSNRDKETVFFRVTVEEDRERERVPTAKDLGINYNSFEPLRDYISKTLFKYDPEIIKGDPDKLGEPYLVQGKYDLNSDGAADIIEVFFKALSAAYCRETDKLSIIRVNDSEIEAFFHNPRGVYVIDFNEDDRFKELIIFDDGPSGDPGINLYRYNGDEVIELGGIGGVIGDPVEESPDAVEDEGLKVGGGPYYDTIKIDGRGRILSPSDIVDFLSPEIILGIREIKEESIEHTKLDYRNMLHQEYEIKEDFQTYFKETEIDTELFAGPSWDEDKIISFNRGEKIYLKDFEAQDARYLVELENGKRGIMYFWTGD